MYIKSIRIKNIRGLPPINLNMALANGSYAGLNVIAGRNGCGKTTLLQSLSLACYGDDVNPYSSEFWLKTGTNDAQIEVDLDATFEGFPDQVNTAQYKIQSNGKIAEYRPEPLEFFGSQPGWFLAGYGPLRRLSKSEDETVKPALERCLTLMKESYTLTESIQWLKDLNHRALEGSQQAKALETQLLALLGDQLLPGETKPQKITSKGLIVSENGHELVLTSLSDGYRTIIAVVMDMVRHMDDAFNGFKYETDQKKGHGVCNHEGVVLIDEVDTHLHPGWQQSFGFWLKSRFPKIQFIVTTHSPFICQAADEGGLLRLDRDGIIRLEGEAERRVINGSVDEAALSELFGLEHSYSHYSEQLREELAKLDAKLFRNRITEDELKRREAIQSRLPDGGGDLERVLRRSSQGIS